MVAKLLDNVFAGSPNEDEVNLPVVHFKGFIPSSDKSGTIVEIEPSPIHRFGNLRYIVYLGEG